MSRMSYVGMSHLLRGEYSKNILICQAIVLLIISRAWFLLFSSPNNKKPGLGDAIRVAFISYRVGRNKDVM